MAVWLFINNCLCNVKQKVKHPRGKPQGSLLRQRGYEGQEPRGIRRRRINRRQSVFLFSLIDLIVTITVLLLLSTILLPVLINIRSTTETIICRDSITTLAIANISYSNDNDTRLVPAAIGDLYRWHGKRKRRGNDAGFDIARAPLYPYWGREEKIEMCPVLRRMIDQSMPAYEKGGFGFGYNENIGSQRYFSASDYWETQCQQLGMQTKLIPSPQGTVMFTETACKVDSAGNNYINGRLAENAFCKSYDTINKGKPIGGTPEPTIHFRHDGKSLTAWVDGHITPEKMTYSKRDWGKDNIGFFGPKDNSLFDPF